ncbi:unnamed protein product [Ceratitis capitata]|uniref:(Mediterranean fruit fly) hypothetical protein n=1 Tax=Ceratitis capitata TaxID=7213 RepID=A0A811V787_CERCA|nr:unnamed protein product [Ceratitis capitata]
MVAVLSTLCEYNDVSYEMQRERRKYNYDTQNDSESIEQDLRSRLLSKRHKYVKGSSGEVIELTESYESTSKIQRQRYVDGERSERYRHKREKARWKREVAVQQEIVVTTERVERVEKRNTPDDPEVLSRREKILAIDREKEKRKEQARGNWRHDDAPEMHSVQAQWQLPHQKEHSDEEEGEAPDSDDEDNDLDESEDEETDSGSGDSESDSENHSEMEDAGIRHESAIISIKSSVSSRSRSRSGSGGSSHRRTTRSRSHSRTHSRSRSNSHFDSRSESSRSRSRSSGSRSRSRTRSRSRSEERDMKSAHKSDAEATAAGSRRQAEAVVVMILLRAMLKGAPLPDYFPGIQGCRSVEEFQCLNRIEEGTYGVVYRAKTNGQHPNIVTVREIVVGSNMDKIFIVMDYVEHDLKSLMETMKARKQFFLPGTRHTKRTHLARLQGFTHRQEYVKSKFTVRRLSRFKLRRRFADKTTDLGIEMLQGLLTYDPKKRLTAEAALKHSYFTELPLPIDPSMSPLAGEK